MPERILIVDDEPANCDLLEAVLAEDGYDILLARNGAQTLEHVNAAPPDLILLDLLMPGMSGLEVCRVLKQNSQTARIPVIVITALGQVSTKEAALMRGADDFVVKPVEASEIRARVAAMLKVRRLRVELDRTLAYVHELEAARRHKRQLVLRQLVSGEEEHSVHTPDAMPVLLVDDEELTRKFYADLLAEHGFQVETAATGEEALDLATRRAFDVAVVDIVMPGMSGLQLVEHLKGIDPGLPAIMLTGNLNSEYAIAALKLGVFDFIVKGLDHSLVILGVHRALRYRREARARHAEFERMRRRIAELEAAQGDR
jgi:two-component system cell cycle response regulator